MTFLKTRRATAAFTLAEMMIAACLSAVIGLIVYGVASESLIAFAKNFSINRSYGDGRHAIDRLGIEMQSAGHTPILLTTTGADTTVSPAAGIRFWRYGSTPCYSVLIAPALTSTSITLSLYQPGSATVLQAAPLVGDMITIPTLGFQSRVVSVVSAPAGPNPITAVLTFNGTIAGNTTPPLTVLPTFAVGNPNPPASPSPSPPPYPVTTTNLQCLDWTSVAFLVVGTQLRYYPQFISGTTNLNTATYRVETNLVSNAPVNLPNALLPFSAGPVPSINVDIYAEAPDYNNRKLGTANTYTYLQTALAPRNPPILVSPY